MAKSIQKSIQLPLLRKTVNLKAYHILGWNTDISVTTKDVKNAGVVIPTISPKHAYFDCSQGRWILGNDSGGR